MQPPLYDLVNNLYDAVMDKMPAAVQERSIAAAFLLGATGATAAVRTIQWAAGGNAAIDRALPVLEKICMGCVTAIPLGYAIIDPEGAKALIREHPVYCSGMAGVWAASMYAALDDVKRMR